MGCGGSKLDPASDMIPARLRPLLRRRFEEINRRRNGGDLKDSTLSKKELLKAGGSDEDSSSKSNSQEQNSDRKSVSSDQEDNLKVAPDPETSNEKIIKDIEVDNALTTNPEFVKPRIDVAQNKPVEASLQASPPSPKVASVAVPVTAPAPASESVELSKEKSAEQNGMEMATAVVEVVETTDEEAEDTEEDDEEGGHGCAERGYICPGSPSFRVFLSEQLPSAREDNEGDDGKNDDTGKVLRSDDIGENKILLGEDSGENVESSNSNEGLVPKTEKKEQKGKRGRGFRKVMHIPKPKGRPGAVKNLLHVNMKSCYNPACSGGQDKASLLSQKVA